MAPDTKECDAQVGPASGRACRLGLGPPAGHGRLGRLRHTRGTSSRGPCAYQAGLQGVMPLVSWGANGGTLSFGRYSGKTRCLWCLSLYKFYVGTPSWTLLKQGFICSVYMSLSFLRIQVYRWLEREPKGKHHLGCCTTERRTPICLLFFSPGTPCWTSEFISDSRAPTPLEAVPYEIRGHIMCSPACWIYGRVKVHDTISFIWVSKNTWLSFILSPFSADSSLLTGGAPLAIVNVRCVPSTDTATRHQFTSFLSWRVGNHQSAGG